MREKILSEYRSRNSPSERFVVIMVAFLRRCLLFRQEKSWEETKAFVSSVPKSSIMSRSQPQISSEIPDAASALSLSKVLFDRTSKSWEALK